MAQELSLTGGAGAKLQLSALSTQRIWRVATQQTQTPDDRQALVRQIASNPELRRQAMELAEPMQRAAWTPAKEPEMYAAMQKLMLLYKADSFEDEDERVAQQLQAAWLGLYYDALREFPIEAIRAGIEALIKTYRYPRFPTPADIREKVAPVAADMRTAAFRLKAALEYKGAKPIDPAERAAVRAKMAEAGWLDAEGNVNLGGILRDFKRRGSPAPNYRRPTETPHEMAARLRSRA